MKPIFRLFLFLLLCSQTSFFLQIIENNIFVFIYKAFIEDIPPYRASERERETNDVWSDDESAEKADRGERFLWDLIVNNDDICFKHILPRLNGTDLKLLYEVNTETRQLIKRSSRARELNEKFRVGEMSSISTLEFAWEHYPWGTWGR